MGIMQTNLRKKTGGFTIIEVLIVLVIAGLIMLIVFLAVPALQRNSRNTQRKKDAAGLQAAAKESVAKRNNVLPTATSDFISEVKLGFYAPANVGLLTVTSAPASYSGAPLSAALWLTALNTRPAEGAVVVVTGVKCNAAGTNVDNTYSSRAIVTVYAIETGGAAAYQCIEG